MTKEEVMGMVARTFDAAAAKPLDGRLGLCEVCEAAARAEAIAGTWREVALCADCAGLVWAATGARREPVYPFSVTFKDGSLHVTAPRYTETIEATVGFADAAPVVVDGVLAGFAEPIREGETTVMAPLPPGVVEMWALRPVKKGQIVTSADVRRIEVIDESAYLDASALTAIRPQMSPPAKATTPGTVRYFEGYTQVTEEQMEEEMAEARSRAELPVTVGDGTLTAEDAAKLEAAVVEQLASTWKTGPDAPPIQLRELPGSSVLFGVSAKVLDPDTGRDRDVRLVVDAGRGLRFELGSARGGAAAVSDVSRYADPLRDALVKLTGGAPATRTADHDRHRNHDLRLTNTERFVIREMLSVAPIAAAGGKAAYFVHKCEKNGLDRGQALALADVFDLDVPEALWASYKATT